MPALISPALGIHDVVSLRTRFRNLRIGQVFYANADRDRRSKRGRWWQKHSLKTAITADDDKASSVIANFHANQMVRVLDETRPLNKPLIGLTYDEFVSRAAL